MFASDEYMGWVVVVCNGEGDFVLCISDFMKSRLDPFVVEI
ncbi:hypothetical protein Gogos_002287 [Gossypium gossypioides]|uniref:Uncharacterized protein n=1 Tax=Gossypium gossypioides TaxID=34282 RepID=A0A7J9CQY7_GOSGO|nr:hypothetical protein [Gossypium gossypioides]